MEKMEVDGLVKGEEGTEVSRQRVEEESVDKVDITGLCRDGVAAMSASGISDTPTVQGFDLNVLTSSVNVPLALTDSALLVNVGEKEDMENILSIATEGSLIGDSVSSCVNVGVQGEEQGNRDLVPQGDMATVSTTGKLKEGPGPSSQEEFCAPTWDETPCSTKTVLTLSLPLPLTLMQPL